MTIIIQNTETGQLLASFANVCTIGGFVLQVVSVLRQWRKALR